MGGILRQSRPVVASIATERWTLRRGTQQVVREPDTKIRSRRLPVRSASRRGHGVREAGRTSGGPHHRRTARNDKDFRCRCGAEIRTRAGTNGPGCRGLPSGRRDRPIPRPPGGHPSPARSPEEVPAVSSNADHHSVVAPQFRPTAAASRPHRRITLTMGRRSPKKAPRRTFERPALCRFALRGINNIIPDASVLVF